MTDTLDDRRFRVLTRLNEELPYTLPQLRVILESLCGAGNYSADVADYTLLVKVGVAAKKNFQDVQTFAEKSCPSQLGFGSSTVVQYSPSIGRVYPCPTCLVHPF